MEAIALAIAPVMASPMDDMSWSDEPLHAESTSAAPARPTSPAVNLWAVIEVARILFILSLGFHCRTSTGIAQTEPMKIP